MGYVGLRNMQVLVECYLSKNTDYVFIVLGVVTVMVTYRIEIELPNSGAWFKYFRRIDSLEEAESLRRIAEGKINARILENM
jgi:hypothetical protein